MAKAAPSELQKILQAFRRITVLSVAAYGLWTEMPLEALMIRVAILWGILSIGTGLIEVLFQYLSMRAKTVVVRQKENNESNSVTVVSTSAN